MTVQCVNAGWLMPATHAVRDEAWTAGEPFGCGNLECDRCARKVIRFDGAILGKRPSDAEWLRVYDAGELGNWLAPAPSQAPFRLYICGGRAFPCGAPREVELLQIEDDLPWACAGHST